MIKGKLVSVLITLILLTVNSVVCQEALKKSVTKLAEPSKISSAIRSSIPMILVPMSKGAERIVEEIYRRMIINVTVILRRDTENTSYVVHRLEGLGFNITASLGRIIEGSVSAAVLLHEGKRLEEIKEIAVIYPQFLPRKDALPNSKVMLPFSFPHFKGEGKIGIIDTGFERYELANFFKECEYEVWRVVSGIQTYRLIPKNYGADGMHGASVAYPLCREGAKLYLISASTINDIYWAYYALAYDFSVDIIVSSLSLLPVHDFMDERSDWAQLARKIVDKEGISIVKSVGNDGLSHYYKVYNDTDGDGLHNFGPDDNTLEIELPYGGHMMIILNYDEWDVYYGKKDPNAATDLDLYLYKVDPVTKELSWWPIGVSEDYINVTLHPIEIIEVSLDPGTYAIQVAAYKMVKRPAFHIWIFSDEPVNLEYLSPERSISSTVAAVNGVIAVGAIDPDTLELRPYSSRGPTGDGRVKPDLVAPDCYYSPITGERFCGTSASAPLLASIILEKNSTLCWCDEWGKLPNSDYGYGLLVSGNKCPSTMKPVSTFSEK